MTNPQIGVAACFLPISLALIPVDVSGSCTYGYQFLSNGAPSWVEKTCPDIGYVIVDSPSEIPEAESIFASAFAAWNQLSQEYYFVPTSCGATEWFCGEVIFYSTAGSWSAENPNLRAYTRNQFTEDGEHIVDFLVKVNMDPEGFYAIEKYSTSCEVDKIDLNSVALHELGHVLGLWHLPEGNDAYLCPTVMRPFYAAAQNCATTCLSYDYLAIAALYPPQAILTGIMDASMSSCDFNPAAEVSDFRVQNGVATWTVQHEWQTKEYILEGCQTTNGVGTELVTDPPSLGMHSVPLPKTSFPIIRLVEVEASGRRHVRAYDAVRKGDPLPRDVARPFGPEVSGARVDQPQPSRSRLRSVQVIRPNTLGTPTVVVYTTPTLAAAVLSDVAPYWEGMGHVVEIVDVGLTFPPGTELEGIKASIADYAADGTKYFHLVGDWEDDYPPEAWASSPYWQSKYDAYRQVGVIPTDPGVPRSGIPTFRSPDYKDGPTNTAITTPYVYTDQWYADTDDDDVPDVVVTRWPFSEVGEVAAAADRLPLAELPEYGQFVGFLVGDAISKGTGSIEIAHAMKEEIKATLQEVNPSVLTGTINEAVFPDEFLRNEITLDALNYWRPDLVIGLATNSGRTWPCSFFVKRVAPPEPWSWNMESLDADFCTRLVLSASCHSAFWKSSTYFCDYWLGSVQVYTPCPSVCDDFLSNDGAGALAWIGPTTGSLQGANYAVARYTVEELMSNPYRPMAESWLVAMGRAYAVAAPQYLPTLKSYAFLGDPLSPYRRLPDRSITARARRMDASEASMPGAFAIGCPQGDDVEKIVVEVTLDAADVLAALNADALTISQPVNGSVVFFPDETSIVADSATALVQQSNVHRTTFTIDSFSGCGIDSALVSLHGLPLGYAKVKVRTPDFAPPYCAIDVTDFSFFMNGYPVVPAVDDCRDVNNDGQVQSVDWSFFSGHYVNHSGQTCPTGTAPQEAVSSNASVALRLTEEYPTATTHRLYVDVEVEDFAGVTTSLFAIARDNDRLTFVEWLPSANPPGTVLFASKVHDGLEHLVVGMAASEPLSGATVHLGRLVFDVTGTQPFELTMDDFALVTGEVLLEETGGAGVVAQMSGVMGRTLDPAVARIYHNRLEQNFPNPFNPTTTLAFSIKGAENVSLTIYDVAGRRVRELVNERRDRGAYKVTWDGQNDSGQIVASGVYFYKLIAGSFTDTKKMTILK